MNRIVSLILLAGGVTLLIYGSIASDSIGSGFSRLFTGSPTDKTIWLFLAGAAVTIVGLSGLIRSSKTP